MDYDKVRLFFTKSLSGDEGQGSTQTDEWRGIQMKMIIQTGRPLVTETKHSIGLELSPIRLQSQF